MSCPTCSATMQAIGCRVTDKNFYWCPRCGTIKPCEEQQAAAPDLVVRCRLFQATLIEAEQPDGIEALRILGIIESINVPANRPS